jgi:thioesterase domain-containing protein
MVPSAVMVLDTLPLTAYGKVDRAALPAPDPASNVVARAPRNEREQILCRVFSEVLDVASLGIDDNFFELGGYSLLAAKLISRIRSTLGVVLGIRDLFAAPTVAGLAGRLLSHGDAPDNPLAVMLPLRVEGSQHPLFCIHPAAGIGWVYAGLLKHLPDIPLYALQARGLTEPDALVANHEQIAADYVRQIRLVQPSGPYRLLGWSFGAGVAHEMATQLREAGEEIDLLAALDGYPQATSGRVDRPDHPRMLRRLLESLGVSDVEDSLTSETFYAAARRDDGPLADLPSDAVTALTRVFARNYHLAGAVTGRVYQGDLLLFVATGDRPGSKPNPGAWRPYVRGRIVVHRIASTHGEMMRPHVLAGIGPVLAAWLHRDPGNADDVMTGAADATACPVGSPSP